MSADQQSPPDLDKILKDFMRKLHKFSTSKKSRMETSPINQSGFTGVGLLIAAIVAVILIFWIGLGFYTVGPAEQAAILRFGKYVSTENPGLHWLPRFIEQKYVVNIQKVSSFQYTSDMLTEDENIVNVSLVVQYRIANLRNYLFNVVNPETSLQQATASALRQVIGNTSLDGVLTNKRTQIRQQVEDLLKQILALYQAGIEVTDVVLQPAKPPEEVTGAFDDAIKAREDEQRFINKAQAYQNSMVPLAQGQAKRLLQEAQAYQKQVVLRANGQTAQFAALLPVYNKFPQVTRERMYLSTIESVLQKSNKVLVDVNGNNLLYLPLNRWFGVKEPHKKPQDN
jgi:membrane protease subunit HflK